MHNLLSPPEGLGKLASFSAQIGADPLLIQGAGGNTSIKEGGVMWIKASGTLLAEAEARDIFVAVDLAAMRAGLEDPDIDADQPQRFLLAGSGLRPSIETSLHAVLDSRVVVHVHCVNTLAHVVRKDAEEILAKKLAGIDWCHVPYVRPGARLAREVRARLGPKTNVVVMANHGLLVAADTVARADALLHRVVEVLTVPPAAATKPNIRSLRTIAGPGWRVPEAGAAIHQVALDPGRLKQATGGSLYPDHVIFCGVGAAVFEGKLPRLAPPVFVLVPGKGAIMCADASAGAVALAECLGDVLLRVPPDAHLAYLTVQNNTELIDWDAEKYRQTLNA